MANTATKVSATPNRLTYRLNGDGTQNGPTIANATLLADMVQGPLRDCWNQAFANQAAMRDALLGGLVLPANGGVLGGCRMAVQMAVTVNDVTAQQNQVEVDVDVDAVTPTKAEINIGMSQTTGQIAYLHITHDPSIAQ